MSKPRVSIGLPVYNGIEFIRESIESILKQTFGDFELIISDNGSLDSTADIVSEYANSDKRIRFYRQTQNLGLVKNFNLVYNLSTADYFRWATADDYISPDYIEKCVKVLDSDPEVVLCYGKTTIVNSYGAKLNRYDDGLDLTSARASDRYRKLYNNLRLCNVQYGLIRSSALKKTALMGDYIGSDEVLLGELSLYGKFVEIPEYMFFRRFHESSTIGLRESISALHDYYHPGYNKQIFMRLWRHTYENIVSVWRSSICLPEKSKISMIIIKRGYQNWHKLIREIQDAIMVKLGSR